MLAKSTEPSAARQIPKQLQNPCVFIVFGGFFPPISVTQSTQQNPQATA